MGMRWDFFQVPHDVNRKWRSLRLDILTRAADGRQFPTVVPEPNTDFDFYGTDNRYFMPRIGIAYRADRQVGDPRGRRLVRQCPADEQHDHSGSAAAVLRNIRLQPGGSGRAHASDLLWRPETTPTTTRKLRSGLADPDPGQSVPGPRHGGGANQCSRCSLRTTRPAASCSGVSTSSGNCRGRRS